MISDKTKDRHQKEAEDFNATILEFDRDTRSSYHLYKLQCGHIGKYPTASIRRKIAVCRDCRKERLIAEATKSGLEFVTSYENIDPSNKNKYRFINCGHEKDMVVTVARDCPFCDTCDNIKHETAAMQSGFTVLNEKASNCCRATICNTCGTKRQIQNTTLIRGAATCIVCRKNNAETRNAKLGEELGLKYKGRNSSKGCEHYFFELPCGHVKSIVSSSLISGSWACEQCDESKSKLAQSFELYVFEMKFKDITFLKVGIANDARFRKKTYGMIGNISCELLYTSHKGSYPEMLAKEQHLFSTFKPFRLHKSLVQDYISNGFTECISISAKDLILDYLDKNTDVVSK